MKNPDMKLAENDTILVSVITVVFNNLEGVRRTFESFFEQNLVSKELVVIDGGSTDGTAEYVSQFSDRLGYWCSEPDSGIYDAMNKGIGHAHGEWICFLNSGDVFAGPEVLQRVIDHADPEVDVLYGNSIEIKGLQTNYVEATEEVSKMEFYPCYRHGSSMVRSSIQKNFLFDLSLQSRIGYALDWEMIYRMYRSGCRFRKVDEIIEAYEFEGVSNHPIQSRWYNYLITSGGKWNMKKLFYFLYGVVLHFLMTSGCYKWLRALFAEYLLNDFLPHIPFWTIRRFLMKMMGTKIGNGSFIMKKVYVQSPNRLHLGSYSHVNRDVILDARGGLRIGDNVSISHRTNIMTGSHDYQSPYFIGKFRPIFIEDYVWIGVGCTILQGITIGRGAVVCSGAVVTHDVQAHEVVAGVPAKVIGHRNENLKYHCHWDIPLT